MKMQLALSVVDNIVTMELIYADAYEAQVAMDDLVERMRSGSGVVLEFKASPQTGVTESVGPVSPCGND